MTFKDIPSVPNHYYYFGTNKVMVFDGLYFDNITLSKDSYQNSLLYSNIMYDGILRISNMEIKNSFSNSN